MPFLSVITVFDLKSILSDISIATLALFWLLFTWDIFFCLYTFNLFVSLDLRWVTNRQKTDGSFFQKSILPLYAFWLENLILLLLFCCFFPACLIPLFPSLPPLLISSVFSWFCCSETFWFPFHFLLCMFFWWFICSYYRN